MARYHAEGVRTVLVCCTGGEEGEILNPAMDTPEVRADIGRVRVAELDGLHRHHRLRRGGAARLPGLGHARLRGQRPPGLLRPGRPRRGGGPAGGGHPARPAPGHRHLRRRPEPSTRTPTTCGSTRSPCVAFDAAGDPGRFPAAGAPSPRPSSTTRCGPGERFRKIHEKFLELGSGVALRRGVAGADDPDRAVHHHDRRHRATPTSGPRPCGPTPPRSTPTRSSGSACPPRSRPRSTRSTTTGWPGAGSDRPT